jgi:hypothetical protein
VICFCCWGGNRGALHALQLIGPSVRTTETRFSSLAHLSGFFLRPLRVSWGPSGELAIVAAAQTMLRDAAGVCMLLSNHKKVLRPTKTVLKAPRIGRVSHN